MTFTEILILAGLIFLFILGVGTACGSKTPNYTRIVESQGYTNVNIGEAAWMGCGKEDSVLASVHFSALGVDRRPVSGVVCCGLVFKSCTVRIEP